MNLNCAKFMIKEYGRPNYHHFMLPVILTPEISISVKTSILIVAKLVSLLLLRSDAIFDVFFNDDFELNKKIKPIK